MSALFEQSAAMSGDSSYVGLGAITMAPSTTNATYNGTVSLWVSSCARFMGQLLG